MAERITSVSQDYEESAVQAIAAAVGAYVERVEDRNYLLVEAIRDAQQAGIKPNRPHDLPFGYAAHWSLHESRDSGGRHRFVAAIAGFG